MSEHAQKFIEHLQSLNQRDRGALAALRHSLAFEPGAYPGAFPYVERFAGSAVDERDARRLALYAVAGLFAIHPVQCAQSFAASFGQLMSRRGSEGVEKRFIALLGADPENIVVYLRQAISLLAADNIGCDYVRLLDDLSRWMNANADPASLDRLRQLWARDFYRAAQAETDLETDNAK